MSDMKRGNLGGPIIIIVAGIILLLNTLDVLRWSFWSDLARFWPVLVIAAGLSLLWRNWRGD